MYNKTYIRSESDETHYRFVVDKAIAAMLEQLIHEGKCIAASFCFEAEEEDESEE